LQDSHPTETRRLGILLGLLLLLQVNAVAQGEEGFGLRRPEILLDCPFGHLPVHMNEVFISGTVAAASSLKSLSINGEPLPWDNKHGWRTLARVGPGRNSFSIKATDAYGISTERIVGVTVDSSFRPLKKLRPRLAVVPVSEGARGSGRGFSSALFGELFQSRRYELLEREEINRVLQELALGTSELTSTENMAKIGRLLVAEAVLTYRMEQTAQALKVSCKLVDVNRQVILWTADYRIPRDKRGSADLLARGIALDLVRLMTIRPSVVLDVSDWPEVYLEGGGRSGISEGVKVLLERHSQLVLIGHVAEVQDYTAKAVLNIPDAVLEIGQPVILYGYMRLPEN